jgi:hypothetical protein
MKQADEHQTSDRPASGRPETGPGAYEAPRGEEIDTSVSGLETAGGVIGNSTRPG